MYLAIGRGRPGGGSSPPQSTPPLLSSNPGSSVPPASLTQGLQIQTQTQTTNPTKYADERKAEEERICKDVIFYNENARRLWLAWKLGGRIQLMHEMLAIDEEDPQTKGKTPVYDYTTVEMGHVSALTVLYTLRDELIDQLILADVYRHYTTQLRRELLGIGTKVGSAASPDYRALWPLIYGNFLCSDKGKTLSFNQWQTILNCVDIYKADLDITTDPPTRPVQPPGVGDWVRRIDEKVNAGKPPGYAHYLASRPHNSHRKYIQESHHITRLNEWVATIRQRLADWLTENPLTNLDDEIPWTVIDIGWTTNQPQRRYDHEHHSGSIRIMSLIDSIAKVEIGGSYKINFLSLYPVAYHNLAGMAEHVLSRLCGSYHVEGGLNVATAGKSVAKATKVYADIYSNIQNQLGPSYDIRAKQTKEKLTKDLEFLELSSHVAGLEDDHQKALDGKLKAQQDYADIEQKYRAVERDMDDAVDAFLAEDQVRRATTLTNELEWLVKYRKCLEAVQEVDSGVVEDDEL